MKVTRTCRGSCKCNKRGLPAWIQWKANKVAEDKLPPRPPPAAMPSHHQNTEDEHQNNQPGRHRKRTACQFSLATANTASVVQGVGNQ